MISQRVQSEPARSLGDLWEVEAFQLHVLQRLISAIDQQVEDNVDPAYPPAGVTMSKAAFDEKRALFLNFLMSHWDGLHRTFALLSDGRSRCLFVNLLLFRALGHKHVSLFADRTEYWKARQESMVRPSRMSQFANVHGGRQLRTYEVITGDQSVTIDCLPANIFFTYLMRQYHLQREDSVQVRPMSGDHVVDAGACFGDTAVDFAIAVGKAGRVYAFDPVEMHLRIVNANITRNGLRNILVFPAALCDRDEEGKLAQGQIHPGFSATDSKSKLPLRTLDSLAADGTLPRVDFIKMDIEGSELSALRGGEAVLHRHRPRLAVSLYHRWSDYIDIPAYIAGLELGYKFYLENYTLSDGETVLYCSPT